MPIDMSAAVKSPPRKRAASAAKSVAPTVEEPTQANRRAQGLMGLGQLLQGGCLMFGQYADAAAIGNHFGPLAVELANAAEGSEALAKPIDMLIAVGPYGALIAAALPLALQLAANHKLVNAGMMMGQGVVPPEVLEAQMKSQVATMQANALREQREAVEQARKAQAEYDSMMKEYETPVAV